MTLRFGLLIFLLLLCGITTMIWALTGRSRVDGGKRGLPAVLPLSVAGLALAVLLASVVTFVGTRDIGVVTSFGRPERHLDNGIHLKAPWENVSTLDGAIQTDNYTGTEECTDIRIGNESMACVDNTIRWRIEPVA